MKIKQKKVQEEKGMVIFKLTPEQKELAIKYLKKETWESQVGKQ